MMTMTQAEMVELVRVGSSVLDDHGLDVMTAHMPAIAIAAMGEEREVLTKALRAYAEHMEQVRSEMTLRDEFAEQFTNYIKWLRSF